MKKKITVRYPLKIGYNDESGIDENVITDKNDNVVVHGWGDCCKVGGIQDRNIAQAIVKTLNKHKPPFYVHYYCEDKSILNVKDSQNNSQRIKQMKNKKANTYK